MRELLDLLEAEQPRINAFLSKEIDGLHPLVRPVVEHVFQGGGKRLRPLLLLLSARCLGQGELRGEFLYPLACSLEFLHSATLMHDDILDGAELRRGTPAAHTVFGRSHTLLAGDALLALGNRLMADSGIPKLTLSISEAIMRTAVGEIAEIAHIRDAGLSEEQYLDIVTGKTAFLIQAACHCGAIAVSASEELENAAAAFGLNLGIAFQLVDDALDYSASQEQLGKPVGSDLREGKLTLPMLLYLRQADAGRRAWFRERLEADTFTETELRELVEDVRRLECDKQTRELAAEYLRRAGEALGKFPDRPEKELLRQTLDYVLTREK